MSERKEAVPSTPCLHCGGEKSLCRDPYGNVCPMCGGVAGFQVKEGAKMAEDRQRYDAFLNSINRATDAEIEKAARDALSGMGVLHVSENGTKRIDPRDFYRKIEPTESALSETPRECRPPAGGHPTGGGDD